ncbi:hypothetical protein GCM10009733_038710 [Nonomuraea maheshkhaliensis]|uniref:Uncharacterized protein n=1 Tax=Nonomuraea maheshkhaliensis TaxID=419590 RepID=A0ABP4R7M2_9ACTN
MPRHALSRIAVAVFAVLVITAGVMAVAYGDARLLGLLVYRQFAEGAGELEEFDADLLVMLVMLVGVGLAQAWGLAQILPGRRGGGTTSKLALPVTTAPAPGGDQGGRSGDSGRSGETRQTRDQLLLRTALYVLMAIELTDQLPWPEDTPEAVAHIAVVVLFYRVMGTVSRTLRLVALLAGLCWPTLGLVEMALDLFGVTLDVLPPGASLAWVVSTILTVVAQAKDGRWGRTTLRAGAVMAAGPFLMPLIAYPDSRTYVIYAASRLLLDVFTVVWLGRSASEVGCRPRAPRPRSRGAFRLRPWEVVAVGLPLLPAVANWTNGAFLWIGPRGAVASWFSGTGWYPRELWLLIDLLAGCGGGAALVLAVVLRRRSAGGGRGRLRQGVIGGLSLAAVAGVVTAVTGESQPAPPDITVRIFLDTLLDSGPGISPLWHSAAFTGSALILLFLYGERPRPRKPYQLALAGLATVALLALVPVSDHTPGPTTTKDECENNPEATGERAFVCAVRKLDAPPFHPSMPDQRLIAYGHRMCAVYTRGDAREEAAFKQAYGINLREQRYLLEDICPKVAAEFDAEVAEEEAEIAAWEAEEQAMCDQAPRHRPRIKPVRAVREKKPVWTELSLEAYDEEADLDDDPVWRAEEGDLVVTAPGRLIILVNTELRMCVTTETYDRRPPVETKGWDHVVEAGYESRDGTLVFGDGLSGVTLPDLASRGEGHYRVRVHYAWLSEKGRQRAGQRLLIMTYPGRGDESIVHREP